jgi:hypothetical protein
MNKCPYISFVPYSQRDSLKLPLESPYTPTYTSQSRRRSHGHIFLVPYIVILSVGNIRYPKVYTYRKPAISESDQA